MIEFRGEPLARLQALGFNAVRVYQEPAAEMLGEAARLGLWIIAPPPAWVFDTAAGLANTIGPQHNAILAWDLGTGLGERDLDRIRRASKNLRAADARHRPLICGPDSSLREYSRLVDIIWQSRPVLGTSLELSDYARWLRDSQLLARPGTTIWSQVQTQPPARLQEQINLLAGRSVAVDRLQDDQVRQVIRIALAAGARGLAFESYSPLDAEDAATKRRAALLELINIELDLIEPWSAAGNFVTTSSSNDPQMQAAVVQTERGRLLLPLRTTGHSQFAVGAASATTTSYVVPGVPETNDAYELTPAGMRPIQHSRVPGGLRVTMSTGQSGSLVVLTQDALVVNYLLRRSAQVGQRAAVLQRELAQTQMQFVQALDHRLISLGRGLPALQTTLTTAQAALKDADLPTDKVGPTAGFAASRRAVENLLQVERAYWERGAGLTPNWLASPLATSVATMPDQWLLAVDLASRRPGANQLAGGNFENLQQMLSVGWRHIDHPLPGLVNDASLLPDTPHGGRLSLRMKTSAKPKDPTPQPTLLEIAPLAITSPPVPVQARQIAWIHGWVRLATPPGASVDGLLITDSLGGDALAERIGPTKNWQDAERAKQGLKPKPKPVDPKKPKPPVTGPLPGQEFEVTADDWKEFSLYRCAPQATNLTLTFTLTGVGEAWLDDVTVQLIDRGGQQAAAK